ncbi:MAG: hypothetical protein ACRDIY_00220, partial [Chloroflexota bacterium]
AQGRTRMIWADDDPATWRAALDKYPRVIEAQGVNRLSELDRWCREELPALISGRTPAYVTLDELVRATEWKMKRGVWRQRNLLLVRSNSPETVEETSRDALARIPDSLAPIRTLARLAGVGPATASAIAAAAAPGVYPFFDDLVARQVPGLGPVDFSVKYYAGYAEALRDRARRLDGDWTPTTVERALWAFAGGKASGQTSDQTLDHERRESERENSRKP